MVFLWTRINNGCFSRRRARLAAGAYRVLAGVQFRSPDFAAGVCRVARSRFDVRCRGARRYSDRGVELLCQRSLDDGARLGIEPDRGQAVGDSAMAWFILVATVPTGLAGLAVKALFVDSLRSVLVIALANLVFAAWLWWSDHSGARTRDLSQMRLRDAFLVGCAQALALIPGTSRSGVTMTMALLLGFTREAAARFSFLLAVPIIILAGGLLGHEAMSEVSTVHWPSMLIGIVVSAVCAFAVIHFFLRLVGRTGMLPFVLYRLALGAILLAFYL